MIHYLKCSDATITQTYNGFLLGFSDYPIPMTLKENEFTAHFFGPEGNSLDCSFLALDNEQPVGVILGGIRNFDGMKTMRCGALCVAPDYRGKGISKKLYDLHQAIAKEEGCKQLFLEVLTQNQRAITLYEKLGYQRTTLMKYYSSQTSSIPRLRIPSSYPITPLSYDIVRDFRKSIIDCHINWQSDTPYYEHSKSDAFLGMYDKNSLIGIIAMNSKGKINLLWVEPNYRYLGVGHTLLLEAATLLNVEKVSITITSNALLEGFFRKLAFTKENTEQLEMHLPL